ncbi:hypothetical protein N8584_01550 [bacterium]|nr:hypothetical protein [bacterium]
MKTPVKMMNVVARKTRLARVGVLPGVGLSALRSILLPALLLSCAHLTNGEILEYTVNFEEESKNHNQQIYDDGEWTEVTVIKLLKGESLEMTNGSIVRQLLLVPDGWHRDGDYGIQTKLNFTHAYLNEEIEILRWGINSGSGKDIYIGNRRLGNIPSYQSYNDLVNKNLMEGPCEIKIKIRKLMITIHPNGNSSEKKLYVPKHSITLRFKKSSTVTSNAQSTANKNILVLPKGTGVNELVLESSEDLITWEKDVPGDKNTDAANRFYRLRAVKK